MTDTMPFDPTQPPPKPTPPDEGTPPASPPEGDEFAGKSPEEIAAIAREERTKREDAAKAIEAAERKAEEARRAYEHIATTAIAMGQQAPTPPAPAAAPPPDPEEDPQAYMEHTINKRVAEALKTTVEPLVHQYRTDRSTIFSAQVESQRNMMRSDPNFPDFAGEVEEEVMKFASQYPAEELAKPGALAECYYRVMGQRTARKTREEAARAQSDLDTSGRPTHQAPEPATSAAPALTDEEVAAASRAGLSQEQFKALQGPGVMSVEDYEKMTKEGAA